jgi:hypothetical protein
MLCIGVMSATVHRRYDAAAVTAAQLRLLRPLLSSSSSEGPFAPAAVARASAAAARLCAWVLGVVQAHQWLSQCGHKRLSPLTAAATAAAVAVDTACSSGAGSGSSCGTSPMTSMSSTSSSNSGSLGSCTSSMSPQKRLLQQRRQLLRAALAKQADVSTVHDDVVNDVATTASHLTPLDLEDVSPPTFGAIHHQQQQQRQQQQQPLTTSPIRRSSAYRATAVTSGAQLQQQSALSLDDSSSCGYGFSSKQDACHISSTATASAGTATASSGTTRRRRSDGAVQMMPHSRSDSISPTRPAAAAAAATNTSEGKTCRTTTLLFVYAVVLSP